MGPLHCALTHAGEKFHKARKIPTPCFEKSYRASMRHWKFCKKIPFFRQYKIVAYRPIHQNELTFSNFELIYFQSDSELRFQLPLKGSWYLLSILYLLTRKLGQFNSILGKISIYLFQCKNSAKFFWTAMFSPNKIENRPRSKFLEVIIKKSAKRKKNNQCPIFDYTEEPA